MPIIPVSLLPDLQLSPFDIRGPQMNESDGSRRPSLTRWLSDKVEDLAGGRRKGGQAPRRGPVGGGMQPDPRMAQQAKEIARLKQEAEELKQTGDRLAKELDDVQVTLIGKEAEFKNELQDLQERNAELLDKIVKLTQRDRELQAKILDAKFDGTGAKDQAKKLDSDLRDLRRSHKAKEEQIVQMKSQLEAMEKEAASRPDPAQAAAETEALTKRLQESVKQVQSLTEERDGLQSGPKNAGQTPAQGTGKGEVSQVADTLAHARGHLAMGAASDPLKAMAAGKRPTVAHRISESRRRQSDAAQKLLESGDRGFATLPDGFIEALLEAKGSRRATGEHRAARRGGSKRRSRSQSQSQNQNKSRSQSQSRSRSRSRRPNSGASNR